MKKRVLSMLMTLALCLTLFPAPAWAAEDTPEGGAIVQQEQQEEISPAVSEQAGTNEEENGAEGDPQNTGTPDAGGAEDSKADAPEIGEDENAGNNADAAVSAVQTMIDALPTVSELDGMTADELDAAYDDIQAAYDAYEALNAEQQAQITGADFEALLGWFNSQTAPLTDAQSGVHTHCVCGSNHQEIGDHKSADEKTFTAWTATDSLPGTAGSYYLTQSVTADWTVPTGEVNLCLNGQTISGSITVGSGATLTLTDCSGNGKVQGEVTVNGGKFELYSGTITGGVQVGIKGGTYQTGSSFTMYGGAITGNEDYGGVFLVGTTNHIDPPSFTMHGGTISDNTAGASDGGGGGVYVGEKCSFTMDGGTITGNTATAGNGGGIYIHFNAGNVSISNATITGNKASATGDTRYGHGGGIYSERGVTVKNVTITGNNSTFEGGGIYGKGAITLTDATVTDNNQYDVYYDGTESTNPKLTVSGSVQAGYYANYDWKLPILVSGALSEDSVIRVGVREGINPGAIAEPASGVTLSAENFKADAADSVTSLGNDGKVYLVPCTHEMDDTGYTCKKCKTQFDARVGDSAYYKTLTDAFNAARGSTVTLLRNVTLTGNCSSENYSATLDLNGKTVSTENKYIHVGGGNKSNTLTVKDSSKGGGTQALNVKFSVGSNGTLAVDDSYTGEISRVELQAGGALERFGGKIGELVLSNAAYGSTSTGYVLKLWKGNTNACTIGKITDNTKSKSLTVNDLLGTDYAKCELYGEKDGAWSIVPKTEKISELTGYTAYKVQFTECVHQCADDSNPVCSVCHKNLYTKITAKAADGTAKTAYFTQDSALENGYVEAIQTLNGWSNEGCTEPTLTLLRDMPYGTSTTLTGTLTLKGGTHTAKNVTVAKNADVTFASGSYKGATIDGTATVKEGVTFTDASVEVNGTLNAKGGTFTGNVKFNGSSIANISGGSFNNEKKYGGVTFDYNVTGTITGGTFTFADFYTTKVKLSGGTFTTIKTNGDRKLADLLAEGAAYYNGDSAVSEDKVSSLANVTVKSHEHNGGTDGKGTCSICGKQMAASLTAGGKTSWYTAFASAIEAANAADGAKTITLYQNVDDTVYGKRTAYELTRGPVTLATGGKRVDGVDLIAKGISLTVTGSNGSFYVTVDGKDAELTVNDKDTKLAIVTAKNGGKLSLSNGTFSRVDVMNDGSSASLSGGSYGEITSGNDYVKPYALLAKGYAYKKEDNTWVSNANIGLSKVTVEKAPFAVEKIYPNSDTNYTGNSAFATDGNITLTAVIAPETEDVTYYYWWELFDESENDWTTTFSNVNSATHTGEKSKTLTISGLPTDKSYQYHIFVQCSNGYQCYSEPFTVTQHQHSWTYTASGATITASCTDTTCTSPNGGSVTIAAPAELTYSGEGKPATVTASSDWQGPAAGGITISYTKMGMYGPETLENGALPKNAGEYTASITMGSATASVTYTIGKATPKAEDFTFTAPTSLTYDGNVKSATVSPADDVIVKYYDKDGKEATPKNAGEYTVKIDVAESTNYKAATELTAEDWKFTISRAKLTLKADDFTFKAMDELIYNGNPKTAEVTWKTAAKAMGFGAITVKYYDKDGKKVKEPKDAGTYTVKIDVAAGVGYEAQNDISSDSWTFTIAPVQQKLTFTSPAINKMYGDAAFTNPINEIGIQGTIAYTSSNANVATVDANGTVTILAASTEPVTITASTEGTDNYSSATASYTLTVAKKAITVSGIAANNKTYDGTAVATLDCSKAVFAGKLENDTLTVTATGTFADKNAGENKIVTIADLTLDGASAGNYTLAASSQQRETSASISPVRLSFITATVAEKIYDSKATATVTGVTITGLIDGETLTKGTDYTVSCTPYMDSQGNESAEAGNGKTLSVMVTLNDSVKNYTFSDGKKSATCYLSNLTIKQATPEITAEASRTITKNGVAVDISGWASFNNTDSGAKLTYTLDGAPTGITLEDNKLKAADDASTVSTFTIKVTAEATTNYTAPAEKTITVTANDKLAPVLDSALTLTPAEITYGEPLSKIKITGTMQDPNNGAEVKGTFAWTNKDFKPDARDSYEAEWTFTPDAPEYATVTGKATVKVKPAKLTVSVKASSMYYTGEEQIASIIASGESVDSTPVTFTYSDTEDGNYTSGVPTFTDAGTYTVYYKAEAANHEPATGTFPVTIKPMELLRFVSTPSVTKTYDGTAVAPLSEDAVTFNSRNASNLSLPTGAYSITNARFTMKQTDGSYADSPEVGNGKSLSFTVTLTSDNYVFESTTEDSKTIVCDIATDDANRFTITKAAAPTDIQTGTLNVVNGTTLEYTYDATQILPAAPNGTYGTVLYSGEPSSNFESGYTVNSFRVGINSGVLTLTIDAQNGGKTGKIGSVTIYVTTDNYEIFNLPLDLYAVNQIKPTLDGKISASEITYGDTLSTSAITGKMKDPNTGAPVNGTFAWKNGTITPAANDRYEAEWTFTPDAPEYATATGTVTVKVNKATPTFNAPTARENLTYTGQEQALITAGMTNYGTMQYSLTEDGTYSQDIPAGTDAGKYTVWYQVIGDANHNNTTPASVTVSIGKKPLRITGVTAASKPYDGTTNADISGVTFDNVTLNRGTDYTVTASFDDASVGNKKNLTATVTLMDQAEKNYALEQSSFTTTGSITAKEVTVTITPNGGTYGSVTAAAAKLFGAVEGDNVPVTLTYTGNGYNSTTVPVNAGSYTVTASIADGNYTLTGNKTAAFVITTKAVAVSGITANDKVYDGTTDATLDCSNAKFGGALENDTLTVTAKGMFEKAEAGKQNVTISDLKLSGNSANNYVLAESGNQTETTATITAKEVTVTPDNKSKVYEEKDPKLTYIVSGVLSGETLKGITLARAEGENAGEYDITGTADAGANPNYDVTFAKGTFTIKPKSIQSATVVLGKGLAANGAEQTQTVAKVLLINKELPADSYTVSGNTATAHGIYTLTVTGKGNYKDFVKWSYVIAPAKAEEAPGKDITIGSGTVKVDVKSEGTVPPATLLTDKAELLAMLVNSGDITADELVQIANGASVDIVLTVKEANVSDEVKTEMAQAAKGYTIGQYLDISLFKYMTVNGSQQAGVPLHTTKDALTISVVVPDALIHTDSAVNRNYCIVRRHDGAITVLDAAFDAAGKTLTFKTDRFSIYAIAYKDTAVPSSGSNPGSNNSSNDSETKKNEVAAPTPAPTPASTSKPSTITAMPQTGDTSNPTLYVVLLVASLLGLAVVFVCKKRNDK